MNGSLKMLKPARKNIPAEVIPASHAPARRSVSRQMFERFERRKTWRRCMAAVYVVVLTAYLAWRYTIINPDSLPLSIAYYVADCIGFILGISSIITAWDYKHREPRPAPPGLSVDVFVPTFREPLHIIRRTAMAAKAINYPHATWILDDGKRDEVRELAQELGLRYLRRPENKDAKAGNLNFGLAQSKADFAMVFDADHIALPHALDVMLGFFDDENVAMVQTPQDYYNTESFQYINARNGGLWHDQSGFYNILQPSGDAVNAASCVGTGVVYRRSALDRIGGIPVETVTEDIHASLKLHKAGYRVAYLNEPIAYGIAAADLAEYYKTRHRWAHGNMHAITHENILFCKGLTLRQRFQYLSLELIYLEGWQQLLLFVIPVMALTFGLQPFQITLFNILVVMFFPFVSYMLLQEMGCGFTRYWANEIFSMARWPIYLISFAGLFGGKMPFRSSSKNMQGRVRWKLMAPQMTVLVVSLAATFAGICTLHEHFRTGPLFKLVYLTITTLRIPHIDWDAVMPDGYTVDLVAIAGFWAVYGAARAAFFVRKVFRDARNSHDFFRFNIPLPVIFDTKGGGMGCTSRISEEWVRLTDYREGPHERPEGTMDMTLIMPAGPLPVKIAIERTEGQEIEGRLIFDSAARRDQLANGLYSVDWHREFLHRAAYFLTPSDLLLRFLRLRPPLQDDHGPWQATLCSGEGAQKFYAIMLKFKRLTGLGSLITFTNLSVGEEIVGELFSKDGCLEPVRAVIVGEEPLSSLVNKGLDGASVVRYKVRIVA
jgi:cellulose synthase (UDP-forming)